MVGWLYTIQAYPGTFIGQQGIVFQSFLTLGMHPNEWLIGVTYVFFVVHCALAGMGRPYVRAMVSGLLMFMVKTFAGEFLRAFERLSH